MKNVGSGVGGKTRREFGSQRMINGPRFTSVCRLFQDFDLFDLLFVIYSFLH